MSVLIVTSLGDIVVDLHADRCPLTCKNFLKLCKIKYYNGSLFHTVQKDFTAQTGDPTGTGTGGDSIYKFLYGDQARFFGDEISLDLKHSKTGTVAMASAGENLNASQFYFTLRDDLDYLDGKHTVFGEVAEGLETLTRINEAYVDEKGRPYRNIRIKHTYILDDPFDDPPQLPDHIPDASPEGRPKDEVDDDVRLEDDWVPMDEQLGRSELEEILRAKQAHSSAVVLESIGDIPDAEIKPPDNVLFVCKLNPVTEDEDLHTIFSRFGTVTSADIIRDFKTGDSLCYAFIEFETKEACEQAYFKMDNALIDDRRIHVDFSQSVARLWSQYRRKDNQKGKGGGCFKCGSLDHIAKDCTGEPAGKQQPPKYILKDDNTQRGGHNNTRYEMVFNEETPQSPQQDKKHRDYAHEDEKQKPNRQSSEELRHRDHGRKDVDGRRREIDRSRVYEHEGEKQKPNRQSSEELRHRDHGRKEVDGGHRESDRSRGFREDERRRERKATQPSGSRRDGYLEERMEREKYVERRDKDKTDERDYRKRNVAGDNRDVRKDDGDNRKRSADDDGRGDRRDDRDYKKGFNDTDRRDKKDVSSYRKGSLDDDRRDDRDYEKGVTGTDRRDKKDEPSYRKRSLDDNGHRRENREHRSADDDGRGDRRDDRDYKKGFNDTDRRDKKDESSYRKGSLDDDRRDDRDYGKGFTGTDRRDKKDEPSYRKRSLDDNGHRRENREHRRRNSESGDDYDRHRDRDKRHQSEKRR